MGNLGSDCADDEIVSDMEDCRDAASQLGRNFGGTFTPYYRDVTCLRPKGCYYWTITANGAAYDNIFFNYDTELPAKYQTDTYLCDTRNIDYRTGGVCKRGTSYITSIKCTNT